MFQCHRSPACMLSLLSPPSFAALSPPYPLHHHRHHHQAVAEEEQDLPGAVPGGQGTEEGVSEKAEGRVLEKVLGAGGPAPGVGGSEGGGASASDNTSGVGDATHLEGDFARGKRLRKLLKVLNSYATVKTMNTFKQRMIGLSLAVLLLHIAAYAAIMASLANQEAYLLEVDAVGECPLGVCGVWGWVSAPGASPLCHLPPFCPLQANPPHPTGTRHCW